MHNPNAVQRFMEPLLAGDRVACRHFIQDELTKADDSRDLYFKVIWPAMEKIDHLYRKHEISIATEHMATRITRALADQLQASLNCQPSNGKRIIIACAEGEPEELGAQMCADLFEAAGWGVNFLGGGVPNDEILSLVGQIRPEVLLIFGTQPQGVPGVRHLIELIRSIDSVPTMNILISGGVFNRADGLWKEINADLIARDAAEALEVAEKAEPRRAVPTTTSAPKKRRRRRRPPLLAVAQA